MSSRNEERLGAVPSLQEPEIQPEESPSMPAELSFVVPTDFVELPSRGAFYPSGHQLHNKETVEVKYMTAKEEDILTSRNYLEKGVVLDRLIQSILVDRSIDIGTLLVADKSAILINARKNGYGEDYTTVVVCPDCGFNETSEYDLNEAVVTGPRSTQTLEENNIVPTPAGTFLFTLPVSKVEVEFRLLTSRDELNMLRLSNRTKKKDEGDHFITSQLKSMIVAANDEDDQTMLTRFVNSLTLRDTVALRGANELVSPSIDMRKEFVCGNCNYEGDVNFPFTTDFFWPQR